MKKAAHLGGLFRVGVVDQFRRWAQFQASNSSMVEVATAW